MRLVRTLFLLVALLAVLGFGVASGTHATPLDTPEQEKAERFREIIRFRLPEWRKRLEEIERDRGIVRVNTDD